MVRAYDGRHQVASECRAGLQQQPPFRVDPELRTVGGQARIQPRRHPRPERASVSRRSQEHDLRFIPAYQLCEYVGIGLVVELLQQRMFHQVNIVGAERYQLPGFSLYPVAQQYCRELLPELIRQFPPSPSSSGTTPATAPSFCSANTHTPLYAERSSRFPGSSFTSSIAPNLHEETQAPHKVQLSCITAFYRLYGWHRTGMLLHIARIRSIFRYYPYTSH